MEKIFSYYRDMIYPSNSSNSITISNNLTKAFGDINASVVYSRMLYLQEYNGIGNEFTCTYEDISNYLGINRYQSSSAILFLLKNKLLSSKKKGIPSRAYYVFTEENLLNACTLLKKITDSSNANVSSLKKICKSQKTYIVRDNNNVGVYKIGKSSNPKVREKTLMHESPNLELIMICQDDIEKELHLLYDEKRLRGEWFILSDFDLNTLLDSYNFEHVTTI